MKLLRKKYFFYLRFKRKNKKRSKLKWKCLLKKNFSRKATWSKILSDSFRIWMRKSFMLSCQILKRLRNKKSTKCWILINKIFKSLIKLSHKFHSKLNFKISLFHKWCLLLIGINSMSMSIINNKTLIQTTCMATLSRCICKFQIWIRFRINPLCILRILISKDKLPQWISQSISQIICILIKILKMLSIINNFKWTSPINQHSLIKNDDLFIIIKYIISFIKNYRMD